MLSIRDLNKQEEYDFFIFDDVQRVFFIILWVTRLMKIKSCQDISDRETNEMLCKDINVEIRPPVKAMANFFVDHVYTPSGRKRAERFDYLLAEAFKEMEKDDESTI